MKSFLLIGQSNMAGRGFYDEAPEIDSKNIKILKIIQKYCSKSDFMV